MPAKQAHPTIMDMNFQYKISAVLLALLLGGCGNDKPKVSTNISDLEKMLQISIPMKSVKWEAFCWPCDDGFLPNQPEFTMLVAEFEPVDRNWFQKTKKPIQDIYIAPESDRHWISPAFKGGLAKEVIDADKFNCTSHRAAFRNSKAPVDGFVCESGGRGLLYLRLDDFTLKN